MPHLALARTALGSWSMGAPAASMRLLWLVLGRETRLWWPGTVTFLSFQPWSCRVCSLQQPFSIAACDNSTESMSLNKGCRPWWVAPAVDEGFGIAHGVQPDALRLALQKAFEAGRRVKGVLVVSPTYFGALAPITGQSYASVCPLSLHVNLPSSALIRVGGDM